MDGNDRDYVNLDGSPEAIHAVAENDVALSNTILRIANRFRRYEKEGVLNPRMRIMSEIAELVRDILAVGQEGDHEAFDMLVTGWTSMQWRLVEDYLVTQEAQGTDVHG